MRAACHEVVLLIETLAEQITDPLLLKQNFLPPALDAMLTVYRDSAAVARDPRVLRLLRTFVTQMEEQIVSDIPKILEHVFEPTLEMIKHNFTDYPEIRVEFFEFLRSVNKSCFQSFFQMGPDMFRMIIDAIVWGIKHVDRGPSETSLELVLELLHNVSQDPEIANAFYSMYFLSLLQHIMSVLTDTWHKSGFKVFFFKKERKEKKKCRSFSNFFLFFFISTVLVTSRYIAIYVCGGGEWRDNASAWRSECG